MGSLPLADPGRQTYLRVGIEDPPEDEQEREGFFSNGGFFQGMRPVSTGCPLPSDLATGKKRTRRPGGVDGLFAVTYDTLPRPRFFR